MIREPANAPYGPEQAIERGFAALKAGDPAMAARWFDRCWRLAPDDPASVLLCAASLSHQLPRRAETLLEGCVTAHPDFGAALLALAAVRYRLGKHDEAAFLLHDYLTAFAPPDDAQFPRLASAIAMRANWSGWIGVDCAGTVTLRATQGAPVTLMLDGAALPNTSPQRLPRTWLQAEILQATTQDGPLLGSPVKLRSRSAAIGVVATCEKGDLHGWAYFAADPTVPPRLHVRGGGGQVAITPWSGEGCAPLGRHRGVRFHVSKEFLPPSPVLRVTGPDGKDLLGSPVQAPAITRLGRRYRREKPRPAAGLPPLLGDFLPPSSVVMPPRPADVIIPVYRGADDLRACLSALLPTLPADTRVTIIDDGSRDPVLRAFLTSLAHPRITILRHRQNRGFPAAANTGLAYAAKAPGGPHDAVLLNDDALVSPGWLQRLAQSAYRRTNIGSVTPATNDGTITAIQAPATDAASRATLADACNRASIDVLSEIPSGTGFCLYLRHDCLAQTGLFREDSFAQGYGEETDWSLRARHLGWRHVADMSVFVAHRGGATFGSAGAWLRTRNIEILERLHPGANTSLAAFLKADPLRQARRRIDTVRWRDAASKSGAVILITHAEGGGVARHIKTRIAALRAQNLRPILVKPVDGWQNTAPALRRCAVTDDSGDFHHLIFDTDREMDALAALIGHGDRPQSVELHHIMGHAPSITRLAERLSVPLDIILHDYALICPRVTLTRRGQSYCGEPADIAECTSCVANQGDRLLAGLPPAPLRTWTAQRVAEARRIVAPHKDVARRFARHVKMDGKLAIEAWEDDGALPRIATPPKHGKGPALRVCVPGAIGDEKGYAVLLACGRDASQRRLNLHFTVAGHTRDDATLMDTDHIFVTGPYADDEALCVITAQRPDIGFIPSIWPETWCYSLTLLWRAGLWPVAFNLGTQAARIAAREAGTILPLGLPPGRINDCLLAIAAPQSRIDQGNRRAVA